MATTEQPVGEFVSELITTYREQTEEALQGYRSYLESFDDPEEIVRTEFSRQAWLEMFPGTMSPANEIALIYDQGDPWGRDRDLIVALSKQIADEHAHSKMFSRLYQQITGDYLDISEFQPPAYDAVTTLVDFFLQWDKPHYCAIAHQCTMEPAAAIIAQHLVEVLEPTYPSIADPMRQTIIADEGDHMHAGRLLVKRFGSPDDYEKLRDIADEGQKLRRETAAEMYG